MATLERDGELCLVTGPWLRNRSQQAFGIAGHVDLRKPRELRPAAAADGFEDRQDQATSGKGAFFRRREQPSVRPEYGSGLVQKVEEFENARRFQFP